MNQTPRAGNVNPPARGSFPLDHAGLCRAPKAVFLECLAQNEGVYDSCRESSKSYLQCRMDGNLMAQEDLNSLGFSTDIKVVPGPNVIDTQREVIAGLSAVKKSGVGTLFGFGSTKGAQRGGGH